MPTVTPTGPLAEPLATLRAMIAATTSFQSWIGATGTDAERLAAALERVHLLVSPADAPRPFAMIDFGDSWARERDRVQSARTFQLLPGSSLLVWFQADAVAGLDEPDATIDFCNSLGAVWESIERDAAAIGKSAVNLISFAVPPVRVEEEKRSTAGDYFECALLLSQTRRSA